MPQLILTTLSMLAFHKGRVFWLAFYQESQEKQLAGYVVEEEI